MSTVTLSRRATALLCSIALRGVSVINVVGGRIC
jgi:hypothetical protein